MSKKTCFLIFIAAMVTILTSYVLNITPVTKEISNTFIQMQNIYIAIASIASALLFIKNKHYWLIMIGLALIIASIVQVLLLNGSLISIALLYKIIASFVYMYLVTLTRYML